MLGPSGCGAAPQSETLALEIQVRLFDALADRNPDYEDTLAAVLALDPATREQRLTPLAQRNSRDPLIASLLDSLLGTEVYALYYQQFHNVSPDLHRSIFMALPYRALPSPAAIGTTQLELFRNRRGLSALVGLLSRVDKARAVAMAAAWSPAADTTVPVTYYIMDGNGDAFASEGGVCFDLYSLLLSRRPESNRYANLADVPVANIEAVLAHEYQHVFAGPTLYPEGRSFDTWQARWEDLLIRRIVSEGVAMQCNPPSGFKKAVFEDSLVVAYWLRELEGVILRMRRNEITEDSVSNWHDRSYHDTARRLLADFVSRAYPDGDQPALLQEHITDRPSAVYTLGWWMLSRIVAIPGGRDQALGLLRSPESLFDQYNAAVGDTGLRVEL